MTKYRLTKQDLWDILEAWDPYLPRKVRVVACGGTALTIQDLKESTKDVDFLIPDEEEYKVLIHAIVRLNYRQASGHGWTKGDGFIFDLFPGKTIFVTELLESPSKKGNHMPIRAFKRLAVSALNDYDLIISKIFRGTDADIDDCLALIRGRGKRFDVERLKARYKETAQYDLNPERMMAHLEFLLKRL